MELRRLFFTPQKFVSTKLFNLGFSFPKFRPIQTQIKPIVVPVLEKPIVSDQPRLRGIPRFAPGIIVQYRGYMTDTGKNAEDNDGKTADEVKKIIEFFEKLGKYKERVNSINNSATRLQVEECLTNIIDSYEEYKKKKWLIEGAQPEKYRHIFEVEINRVFNLLSSRTGCIEDLTEDVRSQAEAMHVIGQLMEPYLRLSSYLSHQKTKHDSTFEENREFHAKRLNFEITAFQKPSLLNNILENALGRIRKLSLESNYNIPRSVMICYAWPSENNKGKEGWIPPFLVELSAHLRLAGIRTQVDIIDNLGGSIYEYMDQLAVKESGGVGCAILVGSPSLKEKHVGGTSAVCNELILLRRMRKLDSKAVIPILLSGNFDDSFPAYMELYTTIQDWHAQSYLKNLKKVIRRIYGISPRSKTEFDEICDDLAKDIYEISQNSELTSKGGFSGDGSANEIIGKLYDITLKQPADIYKAADIVKQVLPNIYISSAYNVMTYNNIYLTQFDLRLLDLLRDKDRVDFRKHLFGEIDEKLNNRIVNKMLAITGPPGCGKTAVAKAYVSWKHENSNSYNPSRKLCWQLDARTEDGLLSHMESLLFNDNMRAGARYGSLRERKICIMAAFNDVLNKNSGWTLVYLHPMKYSALEEYLPSYSQHTGQILVVTRQDTYFPTPELNYEFKKFDKTHLEVYTNKMLGASYSKYDEHSFGENLLIQRKDKSGPKRLVLHEKFIADMKEKLTGQQFAQLLLVRFLDRCVYDYMKDPTKKDEHKEIFTDLIEDLDAPDPNDYEKTAIKNELPRGNLDKILKKAYKKIETENPIFMQIFNFLAFIKIRTPIQEEMLKKYYDILIKNKNDLYKGEKNKILDCEDNMFPEIIRSPSSALIALIDVRVNGYDNKTYYEAHPYCLSLRRRQYLDSEKTKTNELDAMREKETPEVTFNRRHHKFRLMFAVLNNGISPRRKHEEITHSTSHLTLMENLIESYKALKLEHHVMLYPPKYRGVYSGMLYVVARANMTQGDNDGAMRYLEKALACYSKHDISDHIRHGNGLDEKTYSEYVSICDIYPECGSVDLFITREKKKLHYIHTFIMERLYFKIQTQYRLSVCYEENGDYDRQRTHLLDIIREFSDNEKNIQIHFDLNKDYLDRQVKGVIQLFEVLIAGARYYSIHGKYNKSKDMLDALYYVSYDVLPEKETHDLIPRSRFFNDQKLKTYQEKDLGQKKHFGHILKFLQQALVKESIRKKLKRDEHFIKIRAIFYSSFGSVLRFVNLCDVTEENRNKLQINIFKTALRLQKKCKSEYYIARTKIFLASAYISSSDYNDAIRILKGNITSLVSIYGEHNTLIARSRSALGRAYVKRVYGNDEVAKRHTRLNEKKCEKGAREVENAIMIFKKIYQSNGRHPDLAVAYGRLGFCYLRAGKHEKSKKYLEEAFAMKNEFYNTRHSSINNQTTLIMPFGVCRTAQLLVECYLYLYAEQPIPRLVKLIKDGYELDRELEAKAEKFGSKSYKQILEKKKRNDAAKFKFEEKRIEAGELLKDISQTFDNNGRFFVNERMRTRLVKQTKLFEEKDQEAKDCYDDEKKHRDKK